MAELTLEERAVNLDRQIAHIDPGIEFTAFPSGESEDLQSMALTERILVMIDLMIAETATA